MANIKTSPDELRDLSHAYRKMAEQQDMVIYEIRKLINQTQQAWYGDELDSYIQEFDKNVKETRENVQNLMEMANQLQKAAESMETCDQELSSSIRNQFDV